MRRVNVIAGILEKLKICVCIYVYEHMLICTCVYIFEVKHMVYWLKTSLNETTKN